MDARAVVFEARHVGVLSKGKQRETWRDVNRSFPGPKGFGPRCGEGSAAEPAQGVAICSAEEVVPTARAAMRARRAKATIGPAGTRHASARPGGIIESTNNAASATLSHPASPAGSRTSHAAATAASIKSYIKATGTATRVAAASVAPRSA